MVGSSNAYQLYGVYRFKVEIEGLQVAGFSEVSGLNIETEMEQYQEGGLNSFVHHFPRITKFEPLTLRRGITDAISGEILWDWYLNYRRGKIQKKDGSIILQNKSGQEVCRWNFFQAQPIAWQGPTFHSTTNDIAIESIRLVHEGLKMEFATDYDVSSLFE